eukprot:scaffold30089_cov73-Phaeocystis_antarctica.AAC.1
MQPFSFLLALLTLTPACAARHTHGVATEVAPAMSSMNDAKDVVPLRGFPLPRGHAHVKSSIRHNASSMAGMLDMASEAYQERFQPRTLQQYHAAVATVWNLLDRNIEKAARNCRSHQHCPGTPFGYIRPAQLEHYSSFVWRKGPMRYCEIGFNGGHGTVAMLLANPKLQAHSFELGGYAYTAPAAELVHLYFGERFQYHLGNSQQLVPAFAEHKHHHRRASFHPAALIPPRPPRLTRRLLTSRLRRATPPLPLPLTSPTPLALRPPSSPRPAAAACHHAFTTAAAACDPAHCNAVRATCCSWTATTASGGRCKTSATCAHSPSRGLCCWWTTWTKVRGQRSGKRKQKAWSRYWTYACSMPRLSLTR